ncbi:leucine-rich repeat-containing protein 52-like [Corythoichthys intestinalis]|uniref:leucine-rich repeat-containing protein 52-like n=1 Tax=Corythoichthys intestinalis TaxID=161448 RepID=UPI0025A4DD1B|nr:leucine-rich repeat-containing protein 52-like [Corythoichthys intestinalis]XP_061795469.1 leucine-rich repeat-containing protein 52-like [Nerophis lumbriciformis]
MRLAPQPSAQTPRLLLVALLLSTRGLASQLLSSGCPERCVCDEQLVVQCAGQHLTSFPADLPLATRQLIISNNLIAELPALALNYLSDLVYLDCSNNTLTEISQSTFGNLRKLAYLDLSFNILTRIEDRTFAPLDSLVMLRMTDNPFLSEIHQDAFVENLALQVLDVSRNNLTVLNISSLIALPALRSLGLSGNPWSCECGSEELCLWVHLEGFKFQDEGQTVCGSPDDLQGRRLGEAGVQLRTLCHHTLGSWDYLFFVIIGFVIFAAGTVLAWVMGVIMVLYERYIKKKDEQLELDEEEELATESGRTSRARGEQENALLKHTV